MDISKEGNTNFHFYNWLTNESSCTIISLSSSLENKIKDLKYMVRKFNLGYIELLAKWEENGKNFNVRFLLIKNISERQTKQLISELQISTCVFKNQTGFKKINLNGEENILKLDNKNILKKLISSFGEAEINETNFELFEIEPPRASYFQNSERYIKII